MRIKAMTLLEILVVIVILGVLASLAFSGFRLMVENEKAKVCRGNLRIIKNALELYMLDHDQGPANLDELPDDYVRRAAMQFEEQDQSVQARIRRFVRDVRSSVAYAEPFINALSKFDYEIVTCPKDPTPPKSDTSLVSYGLCGKLENIPSIEYQDTAKYGATTGISNSTIIIGDSDVAKLSTCTYSNLQKQRHWESKGFYGQGIRRDGTIVKSDGTVIKF